MSLLTAFACSVEDETLEINAGIREHVKDFQFTRELHVIIIIKSAVVCIKSKQLMYPR